jgi:hypothetical protein
MAERNENVGTPKGGAQGGSTPASAERTTENRDTATRPGQGGTAGQSGTKPGADQARERGDNARPATGRTGDEDIATDEEQDEQGEGEPRTQDDLATGSRRDGKQSGLNTGEEEGDLDAKRTTTGNDAERMQQGGNSGKAAGTNTNSPR